jgi:hypothetical protein
MMPKPNSKKQRALDAIARAQAEVGKALSLLGGRTRYKPKVHDRIYTARQYLESIDHRLKVVTDLVVLGNAKTVETTGVDGPPQQRSITTTVLDDFERNYDSTRDPQC